MSHFVHAMGAAAATAALVGGYAWVGPATAVADTNSDALAKLLSQGSPRAIAHPPKVLADWLHTSAGKIPCPTDPPKP